MSETSRKFKSAIEKQGKDLHKEIDTIIEKMKSYIDKTDSKNRIFLNKKEQQITRSILNIKKNIDDLNRLFKSNDFSLVSAYKSRNADFRRVPYKLSFVLPSFTPQEINKEQIHKQFGSLSAL